MKLRCEVSGIEFEAAREHPINIRPEVIEEPRKKGLGPVQLLKRKKVKDLVLRIIHTER